MPLLVLYLSSSRTASGSLCMPGCISISKKHCTLSAPGLLKLGLHKIVRRDACTGIYNHGINRVLRGISRYSEANKWNCLLHGHGSRTSCLDCHLDLRSLGSDQSAPSVWARLECVCLLSMQTIHPVQVNTMHVKLYDTGISSCM